MDKDVFEADFGSLRAAYREVKAFLEEETGDDVLSLETAVQRDLGQAGDDSLELLIKFTERFNLDSSEFDYCRHFLSEGELFHPVAFWIGIALIPVWILDRITFRRLHLYPSGIFNSFYRDTADLTFGDMVTWYLLKTYVPRTNVAIKLAH